MKISYDPKYDVMYLKLTDGKVVDTIEVEKNVLIDYGDQGEMIGIEIINARRRSMMLIFDTLHSIDACLVSARSCQASASS